MARTTEDTAIIVSPMRAPCWSGMAVRRSFVSAIMANPPQASISEPALKSHRMCIAGASCLSTSRINQKMCGEFSRHTAVAD